MLYLKEEDNFMSFNKKIIITGGSGFIGTHLIDYYLKKNDMIIFNLDIKPPKILEHNKYWITCDILIKDELRRIFRKIEPNFVIHLAAQTDVNGKNLDYYKANTVGVNNLLEVIKSLDCVERLIITSTQYVHQFHGIPKNDEDYFPLGLYGQSKVITEQLTRTAELSCEWCIIRPTAIWGPWHNIYPEGLWKQILKGRYFHPGKQKVIRSYGYVENVVYQIDKLLHAEKELIDKKVFYVGDEPIDLYEWVNNFSIVLTGKSVRVAPRILLRLVALLGDVLRKLGIDFPLYSSRYKNMVFSNPCDMVKTFQITGKGPVDLLTGIMKTADWYLNTYR